MDDRGSAQAINEEAAQWVARIDARPLGGEARLELKQWLARDDRRRGALVRALAVWETLGSGRTLSSDTWDIIQPPHPAAEDTEKEETGQEAANANATTGIFSRRRAMGVGSALAASLISVALIPLFRGPKASDSRRNIKTRLGEMAKVPLQDGSLVVANTTSRLEIAQSADLRSVRLERGEAWFQVAKDANRPFVVSAGDVRVRAVGTAFSVRRREDGADVQVTEGTVEVWSEEQSTKRAFVTAGVRTFVSEEAGAQTLVEDAADIERQLAWREGALKFQGNTIREAAAEFNRYNATKLEVDPALADEKIVGRFSTKEPDSFAREISLAFKARVEREGNTIRIEQN